MPRIGPYTLHTIETGRLGLDGGAMFGIIPKPLWERHIPADARNRIMLHMRCLLLEGSDRVVLIDNGLGDKYDAKFEDIYAVDHEQAELRRSLKQAGFSVEDVTDIILTHLHFDHCGGSTHRQGDRLAVTFSRAVHHIQRAHWDWAQRPNVREKGSFLRENLEPLAASGQLHLVEGAGEILPGVNVEGVHGHTEAQQIVKIVGPEGTLVFVADLLPTSAHLAPAWNMAYDLRPLVTIAEKAAFLDRAVALGWQLFFEHDPGTAVAGVAAGERGVHVTHRRPLDAL